MLPSYAELTPEEIFELNQIGEVCGHSVSHPFLDQLGYDGQWYEIVENKAWLDSITGTSTTCFAYPFGAFNETTTQIVIDAGYQIGFHAWDGLQYFDSMDRWHITRIEVSGDWDLSFFRLGRVVLAQAPHPTEPSRNLVFRPRCESATPRLN